MKTWNLRLVGILGVTLVAVVVALAVAGPARFIRMPDGVWLFVRVSEGVWSSGKRYREFHWGTDTLVRMELDIDGDGRYDVRGDDWQRKKPRWCWIREASTWEPANPEGCAKAWDLLSQLSE
ncbi:hypothetical protein JY651_25410 [Pyxidicoccus parkwayensis]|uniref:Uncharacterized protein n=1 Tax=Pyxidicoccus parkwayensis TaxID=2813578 RepID=A0ABX7NJV7_9BACT|nr:hypothetical protein [Pyxidicoccus parkwaysis]QSQ18703.1 hypothetical protein JY651_25410 [Pyxidicoccus parkwaysis]